MAGCGGSGGWTSDEVETSVASTMQERMSELVPGSTLDSLDCAKRDDNEFTCIASVTAPDGSATLTASVTCEDDCLWTLDNWALKP